MHGLMWKIGLFVAAWYEVSVELGLDAGTAFVLTLVLIGAALTVFRLPAQLLNLYGPRLALLVGPVIIWLALAWWVLPRAFLRHPMLALTLAALLVLGGAAWRYGWTRYREETMRAIDRVKQLTVPAGMLVLQATLGNRWGLVCVAALAVMVAMPMRLGWLLIGPVPAERVDAKMGEPNWFRRAGMSDEL
ncbi:MAG TPA: hypothetical protein VHY35_05430 [Stellaceae bacterium]|nr:hypothetical protein [Stellaceae bacterium]